MVCVNVVLWHAHPNTTAFNFPPSSSTRITGTARSAGPRAFTPSITPLAVNSRRFITRFATPLPQEIFAGNIFPAAALATSTNRSIIHFVYSTVSGRRFTCDLEAARDAGHIDAAPHYNSVFRVLEDADTTPVLKRLIIQSSVPLRVEGAGVTEEFIHSHPAGQITVLRKKTDATQHGDRLRNWIETEHANGT